MPKSNEHRKVRYTKRVIRESLFALLDAKELNRITVKELCELADINRGTFYSHYTDIYDLVDKLEGELLQRMMAVARFEEIGKNNQAEMLADILAHIKNNVEDYRVLVINPEFSRCLDEFLAETYKHHAMALAQKNPQISKNMIDYSFAYLSSGSTRAILKWIENDFEESPEEMAALINAFSNCGITHLSS